MNRSNWAGNYTYSAARYHTPETVEQVQERVARCRKIKTLGSRHSFNGIADCTEDLLSLTHLDKIVELDRERQQVTIEGGVRYGPLSQYLHAQGYALHNLASLPHISVAGACATATHGSGVRNGSLATAVSALEMVTADGTLKTLFRERGGDEFQGAVVGLGALGVVTQLTLDIEPTFVMRQEVYENLPLTVLEAHFEEIISSAYSVSLFTDWQSAQFNQVWRKLRITEDSPYTPEPNWFGATPAARSLHPIASISAENCTAQQGLPGPWHERLPHFRMEYTPSNGEELQTEYFVPRQHALDALHALHALREHLAPLLQISEVRTIAADEFWMSPCYQQDCIAIHFTWVKDWPAVNKLLPIIESQLAPLNARPHWGKLFTHSAQQLDALYPKLPDFRRLMHACDPDGKFLNAFLEACLFSPPGKI